MNNKIVLMDQSAKSALTLTPTTFSALGVRERQDLEEWIKDNPDILGTKLLLVTSEYDGFENSDKRLDLLAIDDEGKLVIVELKRDVAGSLADLQAIRYAAFCSTMTFEKVVSLYARFANVDKETAKQKIQDFVEDSNFSTLDNKPRIILAAGSFEDQEVTSCVLWLRSFEVDITCVEITPYRMANDNRIILVPRVIIPLPEAKEYQVGAEKKEAEEGRLSSRQRKSLTEGDLLKMADGRKVNALVDICRQMNADWDETPSAVWGGSFVYSLTTEKGWRSFYGINVSGERMKTPDGELDIWIATGNLAELTEQDEAVVRDVLARDHPQLSALHRDCIVRLSTPAQAEALVRQLKNWAAELQ